VGYFLKPLVISDGMRTTDRFHKVLKAAVGLSDPNVFCHCKEMWRNIKDDVLVEKKHSMYFDPVMTFQNVTKMFFLHVCCHNVVLNAKWLEKIPM